MSKAEETLAMTDTMDDKLCRNDKTSHARLSPASDPHLRFSNIWKHLVKQDWHVVPARKSPRCKSTWYFVQTYVCAMRTAKHGRNYFTTPEELMAWTDNNPYAMRGFCDYIKDTQHVCMISQSEDNGGDKPDVASAQKTRNIKLLPAKPSSNVHKSESKKREPTKRITLLPAKPSSMVRMGASKKRELTKRITPLLQSKPQAAKPQVAKTEWWHKEAVPSSSAIWSLLGGTLQFCDSIGKCCLPKDAQSSGTVGWDHEQKMRMFLCQHGITNYNDHGLIMGKCDANGKSTRHFIQKMSGK
jgi:hypothetical protein